MADSKMSDAGAILQLVGIPLLLGLFGLQYFQGKAQLSEITSLRSEVAALHTQVVELKKKAGSQKSVARAGGNKQKSRARKKRGGPNKRPQGARPPQQPQAEPQPF